MNSYHWATHIIIPVFHQACIMNGHFLNSSKCEIAATQERREFIIQLVYKSNENSISEYEWDKTGSSQRVRETASLWKGQQLERSALEKKKDLNA